MIVRHCLLIALISLSLLSCQMNVINSNPQSPSSVLSDPLKLKVITHQTRHPDLPGIRLPGLELEIFAGQGQSGYRNGSAQESQFNYPGGMVADEQGNLYLADALNHRIRKISSSGEVTSLAGSGIEGVQEGDFENARFSTPLQIHWGGPSLLYVLDQANVLYSLNLNSKKVEIVTYGQPEFAQSRFFNPEIVRQAKFIYPEPINSFHYRQGSFYIANDQVIERVSLTGDRVSYAGARHNLDIDEEWIAEDGPPEQALFRVPLLFDFGPLGDVFLIDNSVMLRKVESITRQVTTLAGRKLGSPLVLGSPGDGSLSEAVLANALWLSYHSESQVLFFVDTGSYLRAYFDGRVYTLIDNLNVLSLLTTSNNLYITDTKHHRLYKMNLKSLNTQQFQTLVPLRSNRT